MLGCVLVSILGAGVRLLTQKTSRVEPRTLHTSSDLAPPTNRENQDVRRGQSERERRECMEKGYLGEGDVAGNGRRCESVPEAARPDPGSQLQVNMRENQARA